MKPLERDVETLRRVPLFAGLSSGSLLAPGEENAMEPFLQTYGLWILLAGVFLAMHWFGIGCGGGHGRGPLREDAAGRPGEEKQAPAHSGRSCH